MTKAKSDSGPFYGWVIVACCVLLSASAGIISGVLSTFIKPVSEQLGVSRSAFSLTSTAINVTIMLLMPFVAGVFKRMPFKRTVLSSATMVAIALFCFSYAQSLTAFYLLSIVCGLFSCFMNAVPIVILTSNWFVEKRGVATSISFSGMGISSMLLSPVAAWLIETVSWRSAYRVLGIAFFLLSVPATLLFVREKPQDMGLEPLGAQTVPQQKGAVPRGFFHKQAIQQRSFWLFAIAIAFISLTSYGVQQHVVSYWSDLGYASTVAAAWFSAMMAVGILSKAVLGAVFDRFGIRRASTFICLTACLAYVLLNFCGAKGILALFVLLFGLSSGIQIVPPTYITNRLFGDLDYSANYGLITTIYYLGMAVGIPFSAFWFDRFHTYRPAWCIYALLILAALGLILAAERRACQEWEETLGTVYPGKIK